MDIMLTPEDLFEAVGDLLDKRRLEPGSYRVSFEVHTRLDDGSQRIMARCTPNSAKKDDKKP